ncbi:MAG: alkaline phytoceramidase [Acidobacteria bacterium]|nr:MAG: alkaline phytoceramidase [Acidobacteriota bacterium]
MGPQARVLVLLALTVVPIVLLAVVPPFAQPLWYHDFADQRCLFCIPHCLNVVSNLPFLIVGLWGMAYLMRCEPSVRFEQHQDRWYYGFFFFAVALTGIGSAYYHSDPTNERLLWDRLPLAMAFMALFAMVIAERISYRAGITLFMPLVILGGGTVVYWHFTEQWGRGDLRPYLLVQLYPLLAIPLILLLFPARFTLTQDLFAALLCYLFAKGLELADRVVYAQGAIVSGHTLKHLIAALAPYFVLHMLKYRRLIGRPKELAVAT